MIQNLKQLFRKIGLRRYHFDGFHYRLDQRLPTRYLSLWLSYPALFHYWWQNTTSNRTIRCAPEKPLEIGYEIVKLAMVLGIQLCEDVDDADLGLTWQDITVRTAPLPSAPTYFLNRGCPDIGKDHVQDVFESVFGYPLRLDPTKHHGTSAKKSVRNATHDGAVVECPISVPEPGFVYQKLINNRFDDEHIFDLRTPFYHGTLPLVYRKLRPIKTRFGNTNAAVKLLRTEDVFSTEEQAMLIEFGQALKLDYGGMDVLRDMDSNKLYVVDVNTTPFGPPAELPNDERRRALSILAQAFQKLFINPLGQPRHV